MRRKETVTINTYVEPLLAHIPGGYSHDPQSVSSLFIGGEGSVSVAGDSLYITSNNTSYTFDLHALSVTQLASQIVQSGLTYFIGGVDGSMLSTAVTTTVLQGGMADLLDLPDGQSSAQLPATLVIPSNPLYYYVGMVARMLESLQRSAQAQAAQINLQAATTRLLDFWGASVGVPRYTGEPDALYAQRMTAIKFRPNVNNVAIEQIMATLGYTATVTDSTYGAFTVSVTLPSSPPSGFSYTLSQLQDVLDLTKAAGINGTILAQGTLADSTVSTDSLSYTLQTAAWTVGNVNVGQFSV